MRTMWHKAGPPAVTGPVSTFVNELTITRPVDEVFNYLADFENVPRWNYAIVETRPTTPGPVAVGSTYRQTRSIPSPAEESFEVTRFEPFRALAIRGQLGPFPAVVTYQVSADGVGTRLVNTVELELRGAARLAGRLVTAQVKTAVAKNLDVLRQILEDTPRPRL